MKTLRRIITGFGVGLFVAGCAAVLLTSTSTSGWQLLSVPTASMQPSIDSGSLALVHRVSDPLKVGDVITYTNPAKMNSTLTHRIVRIEILKSGSPQYFTKGDANKTTDPLPVIDGLIKGKVVASVPYVGSLFMWAKTWVGIALLVYLPAVILLSGEMRKLITYWRLTMPKSYRLFGYRPKEVAASSLNAIRYASAGLAVSFVGASAVFALPVYALLQSNTVSLTPNTLIVASTTPPQPPSTCTNNNNINVTSTSTQTATTGNANNSGNTNGGSATSGNATNNNSTNVNISVNNGC